MFEGLSQGPLKTFKELSAKWRICGCWLLYITITPPLELFQWKVIYLLFFCWFLENKINLKKTSGHPGDLEVKDLTLRTQPMKIRIQIDHFFDGSSEYLGWGSPKKVFKMGGTSCNMIWKLEVEIRWNYLTFENELYTETHVVHVVFFSAPGLIQRFYMPNQLLFS